MNFKSGEGGEAADSTDSTEPIHLVLQHLRESFSLSQGEVTPSGLKLIHYTAAEGFPAAKMSNKGFFTCLNTM
ncbi:hypothetical protein HMPREF2600_07605 [Neisseria sp. HMSC077D05]|nr:hypothetical protein HMPREF2600_07605 [Neisseria sp. HMSC077D05]